MRSIKTHLICLTILISNSIAFSQNKYNLNFDDFNSENQTLPNGWSKGGSFKNITIEKIGDHNFIGKVISDDSGKFGCFTYKIPANYTGDSIKLTGRIKHEKVKGSVGLWMRIDGYGGKSPLAFDNMYKSNINGTNDWKEYSIKLPYPTGAEFIYVGGLLSGKGTAWFDDFKITIDGKDIQTIKETPKTYLKNYNSDELNSAIVNASTPIQLSTNDSLLSNLDPLIAKLGNKKIVAIGESTHGTSEFYQLREIITKRLIKEKGFNLVVLESPYDDIELLNKDLLSSPLDSLIKKHLFSIYQTKEMKSFLQWYKDNRLHYDIKFKGCDDSMWSFYELLDANLKLNNDKKLNKLLAELNSNITKSTNNTSEKENKIYISIYYNIIAIEEYLKSTNRLTPTVEEILYNGKTTYINDLNIKNKKQFQSRDEIMADRVSFLAKNTGSKIVVWAHNAHISNEIITDNEIGIMGRDLKKEFGNDYHSIGLSTLSGNYSFIDEKLINGDHFYADKLKKNEIQLTETYFWENALATNGKSFYLDISKLKKELKTDEILGPTKLIGYSKETKEDIYQLPFLKLFDSLIFIQNTNATTSLTNKKDCSQPKSADTSTQQ
jgi:erythromycin esterase